ncbi:MAG TPA: hypothetical protein VEF04_14555, partial [Blastocatellia bacterium]|nr:hypothetical protein [Blastocatellia bacterium]
LGFNQIDGIDPFTGDAYLERTGQRAEAFTFTEIANGVLSTRRYDLCVCSFAMHLAETSLLPNLCLQLAMICNALWIITPHKRPQIKSEWGWQQKQELLAERVRLRQYASILFDV